jgi:hypothetical protein
MLRAQYPNVHPNNDDSQRELTLRAGVGRGQSMLRTGRKGEENGRIGDAWRATQAGVRST